MADISAAVRAHLIADSGVSAITTRCYSDALPQGVTLPAIRYTIVTSDPDNHLGGSADSSTSTIQIDCHGATRTVANSLSDAVRIALNTDHVTMGSVYVLSVTREDGPRDFSDPPSVGSDQRRYVSSTDYRVKYRIATS